MVLEIVDMIGRYGLPTVAAGLILWLYVRSERRQEQLLDRWELRMFGDGNGTRGKLSEAQDELRKELGDVQEDLTVVREQVERIAQREDIADAGRVECHHMFRGINNALSSALTELSAHNRRIIVLESVVLPTDKFEGFDEFDG